MSALPLKADMLSVDIDVCFVPEADTRPWHDPVARISSSPTVSLFLFAPQVRKYALQNLDHFRLVLLRQVDQHAQTVALL